MISIVRDTHKRNLRSHNGLTLMEILLATALVSLVGLSFAAIYGSSQHYMIQDIDSSLAQGDASYAMDHMKRHLERATTFNVVTAIRIDFDWWPNGAGAPVPSSYRLNGNLLEYRLDAGEDTNGNGILDPGEDTNGNGILDAATPWEVLIQGVTALTFTRVNSFTVTIDMTVKEGKAQPVQLTANVVPVGMYHENP